MKEQKEIYRMKIDKKENEKIKTWIIGNAVTKKLMRKYEGT